MKIFQPVSNNQQIKEYLRLIINGEAKGNYAVMFGFISAIMSIPLQEALCGFYYNAAAGMVTNAVKLIPLGQQQGQEILFSLHELIETLSTESLQPDPEMIGICCPGFDLRAMQHEQLYTRLYMS